MTLKSHFHNLRKYYLLVILFASTANAFAQTPKEYLQKSMAAYEPWNKLTHFYYAVDRTNTNPWQAYAFVNPQPAKSTSEVYMDIEKNVFQNRTVFNYPGGYVFDFVNIGKDSTRWLYDNNASRNGKALVKQGRDAFIGNKNFALQSLPYYTVKALAETTDSLAYNKVGNVIQIKRFLKNGSTIDYLLDE